MRQKISILLGVLSVLLIVSGFVVYKAFAGPDKTGMVYIYPDMTKDALKDSLETNFGSYGSSVATFLSVMNVDLNKRVGAYEVKNDLGALKLARQIKRGNQSGIKFTFNNIRTKDQFAELVGNKMLMSKDDMLNSLNDSAFCAQYGKTPETIVCVLVPDSYEVYWNASVKDLVDKLDNNYKNFWNEARTAKAASLGLTPDEVCTIASITEEETVKSDEQGKVARLYINRYKQGMKLQADPTVKFALGDFSIRRITLDMLSADSPYNTYKFMGLPPGPIRIPSKSTIDAVLNAPEHKYVYMCAKEDFSGYHNFTDSYTEHTANAARYQLELNKRGIK